MNTRTTCQHCGVPVAAGARFCANCGTDVSAEQGNVATRKFTSTQAMHDQLLARLRHATLGDHEVLTELGRGGMATVYLAHDIQLDRKVAIKVMLPALLEGDDMVERFRLEARTAAALSHPHIIPIYAVKAVEGLVYFVMKFVEGRPLDAIVKELGQLPVPMVRSILSKVGEALGYAHRRGVVHRDIKPANLMIDVEGLPIVTDFGIAKVADAHGLTMTGAMMGTPTYMSPEQCSAGEITGASDQYSLGVVAYQMLGGRVPFEGDTLVGLLYKHCHDEPPPLLDARPDCPPALNTAVMKMLAKDPRDRFPTMEAAVEAIGAVSLSYDDPVRTQLIGLARRGENVSLLKRISTPMSPVPRRTAPVMASDAVTTPAATPATSSAPARRSSAGIVAALGLVILAGGLAWWRPWSATDGTVAATPAQLAGDGASTGYGQDATPPAPPPPAADAGAASPTTAAPPNPAPVASIRVSSAPASLTVGETVALVAVALDARSGALPGRPIRWSSSNPSIATVSAEGRVTARQPGQVTLTARTGEVERTIMLDVQAVRAATLALSPPPALTVGETARLDATVLDGSGARLDRSVSWRSADESVATVRDGVVTAVGAGSTTVSASADGREASVSVRVAAAQVAAAPSPQPPAPQVTIASTPADARAEVERALQRYATALTTRQLSEVRAAYPGLTAEQEAQFTQTLRTLQDLRVNLRLGTLNVVGDQATAAVSGTYEFYSPENRRTERLAVNFTATLDRGTSGWVIRSIR